MEKNKEKNYKWLKSFLTGWGIKESWAKLVAGAIIGALCACGFLTSCSCVTSEQIYSAHEIYHTVTDKPCIFIEQGK
ncbi:MAG: hypothetical protein E7079_08110 [Bacteroidales bacterium]|nr:hypothetical protein [Bacteroidales bacterium]